MNARGHGLLAGIKVISSWRKGASLTSSVSMQRHFCIRSRAAVSVIVEGKTINHWKDNVHTPQQQQNNRCWELNLLQTDQITQEIKNNK